MAIAGALLIGLVLGILGSGGTIITIPILIYGLAFSPKEAVIAALLIVGIISLISAFMNTAKQSLPWAILAFFGVPGAIGAVVGAKIGYSLTDTQQLQLFAVIMLAAGIKMFFRTAESKQNSIKHDNIGNIKILLAGFVTGCVTGCVGVGGGFLIVPALLMFTPVTFSAAVSISLIFISINALTGFATYMLQMSQTQSLIEVLPWQLISLIITIGLVGSYLGGRAANLLTQGAKASLLSAMLLVMATVTFIDSL